jgi:hypothetical protein
MADTSLQAVTPLVRRYIAAVKCTTHNGVTDAVIAEYSESTDGQFPEQTLRRRIYDVVTVLCVVGLVQRVDKALLWTGELAAHAPALRGEAKQASARIGAKEQLLERRLRLFLGFKALIEMNRNPQRPARALPFPMIVVGLRPEPWSCHRIGVKLAIEADSSPVVLSPADIIASIAFTEEAIDVARRCLPESPLIAKLVSA